MSKIDKFTAAYIECALWCGVFDGDDGDADYSRTLEDLSPDTLASMVEDCADFQNSAHELLERSGQDCEQSGHDFWLTRNHHGAGFWDRGLGDIGDRLTEAAKNYGSCELYLGDDGKVWSA